MRRFVLRRSHDVTGVSGVGDVAEGIQFTDGTAVIRWTTGEHRSTVIWPDVDSAEKVHGHGGNTVVAWIDPDPDGVDVTMFGGTVRRLPAA
jgi:hypothetical protein